jgi:hypothetical protein
MKFVSGFLRVLKFSLPIKLMCHDITEILLKFVVNTITPEDIFSDKDICKVDCFRMKNSNVFHIVLYLNARNNSKIFDVLHL